MILKLYEVINIACFHLCKTGSLLSKTSLWTAMMKAWENSIWGEHVELTSRIRHRFPGRQSDRDLLRRRSRCPKVVVDDRGDALVVDRHVGRFKLVMQILPPEVAACPVLVDRLEGILAQVGIEWRLFASSNKTPSSFRLHKAG